MLNTRIHEMMTKQQFLCQTQEIIKWWPCNNFQWLKAFRMIQKKENLIPYEIKPKDVERWFCMWKMLHNHHKKISLLHHIITDNKKWIYYDNSMHRKSCVKPNQPAKLIAKPNIHAVIVMLYIWQHQKGVVYYELLIKIKQLLELFAENNWFLWIKQ